MKRPLEGIRVVDWTTYQQGSLASSMLGDLGAEVIKIEHPLYGDPGRGLTVGLSMWQNFSKGTNNFFESNNRSKKSVTLDLKKEKSGEILRRLIARSDVFLHNSRPGPTERLGLDYENVKKINPRIIYAHASGYGLKGPLRDKPALDPIGFARSGLMDYFTPPSSGPAYVRTGIIDQLCGTLLAHGVMIALLVREREGIGQMVHVSQLTSAMWLEGLALNTFLMTGRPTPKWDRKDAGNPLYNFYRCSDGRWLFLALLNSEQHWSRFCQAISEPELENDPRFNTESSRSANRLALIELLDEVIGSLPAAHWEKVLTSYPEFVYEFARSITEVPEDPQVIANDSLVDFEHPALGKTKLLAFPIQLSETPAHIQSPAPQLGQHTEEVLVDICGYTWDEVLAFGDQGIIAAEDVRDH